MACQLEGRLLEVCTCNVLCPCWVGEDPDNGTCDGTLAWHTASSWLVNSLPLSIDASTSVVLL